MPEYRFQQRCNKISVDELRRRRGDVHACSPEHVLMRLQEASSSDVGATVTQLGTSYQGRPIHSLTVGTGPRRVLLWSQMHGDEPTHTIVLADLLGFLMESGSSLAKSLLEGCELTLIPMLNPDGAVLQTRRNAQLIDINRDARHCHSPEGAILRDAVMRIQPEFAFNLHNHNSRRTIAKTGRLAAVALLAPPVDSEGSEPDYLVRAKQIGSCFCMAIAGLCDDMVWRYEADYMPRAFGEWVQSQGVSTLLVEAGGWPGDDQQPLLDIHFRGLLGALEAIATGEYESVDIGPYERLPQGAGFDRLDCVVREVVLTLADTRPFAADVGVNFLDGDRGQFGCIAEIGDLYVHDSDSNVLGAGACCYPGKIIFDSEVTPFQLPDGAAAGDLFRRGVTSVVGVVKPADLRDDDRLKEMRALGDRDDLLMNVAFSLVCSSTTTMSEIADAHALGVVAVTTVSGQPLSEAIYRFLKSMRLPILTAAADDERDGVLHCELSSLAKIFAPRGTLRMGAPADFAIGAVAGAEATVVMIGGQVVYQDGELTSLRPGRWLRRSPSSMS